MPVRATPSSKRPCLQRVWQKFLVTVSNIPPRKHRIRQVKGSSFAPKFFSGFRIKFFGKVSTRNDLRRESLRIPARVCTGSYLGGKLTCCGDLEYFCLYQSYVKIELFKMCFFRLFHERSNISKIATTVGQRQWEHTSIRH